MHVHLPQQLPAAVHLPTSKSISARALIINALSAAPRQLVALSDCDDTVAMQRALGSHDEVIDIGAAGTAMRFLTAYFAAREGDVHVLTGTTRMRQRPIGILVEALRSLGADISYCEAEGCPPLRIVGRRLEGGAVRLPADVSSQYVSALLMLGPTLSRGLELELVGEIASRPYIEMTLSLMRRFGACVSFEGQKIVIEPTGYGAEAEAEVSATESRSAEPRPDERFVVEPDWSAASYWFELVALSPDPAAHVALPGLAEHSVQGDSVCARYFSQLGVQTAFTAEGAVISKAPAAEGAAPATLELDFSDCPDLAQTFTVTAALLRRPFRFTGLRSLKIKETDRIAALISELSKLGFDIVETAPGILEFSPQKSTAALEKSTAAVENSKAALEKSTAALDFTPFSGGETASAADPSTRLSIATYADHRMAMAFAPAAYFFPGLDILNPEVVSKSYPAFWTDLGL